jgi:ornithine decarboxylase
VNVGGGFPSHYMGEKLPNLEDYFCAIGDAFEKGFSGKDTTLIGESGGCFMDSSISLLCQVKYHCEAQTLFINDGVYGGFIEQILCPIVYPMRAFLGKDELTGECAAFVCGAPPATH